MQSLRFDGGSVLSECLLYAKSGSWGDRDSLFNFGLSLTFSNKKAARRQLF